MSEDAEQREAKIASIWKSMLHKLGALTAENIEQFQRLATLERRYEALGRSVAESGLVIAQRLNALEAENRRLTAITAAAHQEVQRLQARLAAVEMLVETDREKLADHSTRLVAIERMAPEPGEQTDRRW